MIARQKMHKITSLDRSQRLSYLKYSDNVQSSNYLAFLKQITTKIVLN